MTDRSSVTRRGFLRGVAGTAALAGASGTAVAQEDATVEVELVDFAYEPGTEEPLVIPPGTTVTFVWVTSTHNINVTSQPEGSDWEGHLDIEDAGFETSHTFEVEGTYEFHCDPHVGLGMEGTIEVEEGAPVPGADGGDGGGAAVPGIPDAAKTIGLGLSLAMLATLALAYSLLRYGGNREEPVE